MIINIHGLWASSTYKYCTCYLGNNAYSSSSLQPIRGLAILVKKTQPAPVFKDSKYDTLTYKAI